MSQATDPFRQALELHQSGELRAAEGRYRQAITLQPQSAAAHRHLGLVLADLGRHAEAAECQRQTIALDPQSAAAHQALGTALWWVGRLAEAEACFRRVLELEPENVAAMHGLGGVLLGQHLFAEAEDWYRRVVQAAPDHADSQLRLGQCLHFNGKFDEAIERFRRAIVLGASPPECDSWIAQSHLLSGDLAAAGDDIERALELSPQDANARVFRATLMLTRGDMPHGWHEFEHRTRLPEAAARPVRAPLWDGAPLDNWTLLVESERGLGDTLQFVRYLPLLAGRCRRVLFEARPSLVDLLRESGIENVIAEGDPLPPIDARIPLMSLPARLETTLSTIPAEVPYLRTSAVRVAQWRQRLSVVEGLKVGIHWQGNPTFVGDRHRSIPLSHFGALVDMPGVQLVSLQKDPAGGTPDSFEGRLLVFDDLDREGGAFLDTAAIIENLDLVITSDSAVAHLAGALAAPVWLVLSTACDWRWLVDRSDSPWYPTMRIFRQITLGDWPEVFARLAAELAEVVASSCPPSRA